MTLEAVLLTGGASRRMGVDKAKLSFLGEPSALRIARELRKAVDSVTVLGPDPLSDCGFLPDSDLHAGPLAALSRFTPACDAVFVCGCDLPLFDHRIIAVAKAQIGLADAAVLEIESRLQPLCALYRSLCFQKLARAREDGTEALMTAIAPLTIVAILERDLLASGLDARRFRGANTPEEWRELEESGKSLGLR